MTSGQKGGKTMRTLVLGASGGIGYAIVQKLVSRGCEVVAFARGEEKLVSLYHGNSNVTICSGDALKEEAVREAARGVEVIFHAVSFPYDVWQSTHPKLIDSLIRVAKRERAKIVLADNVYAYGKQADIVNEQAIKNPHTAKGKIRLHMEEKLKASEVPSLIAHLPDLYGPNAENTLLHETLKSVANHKRAHYVGRLDKPREFLFTFDGAAALVELAFRENTYNQNWNIPAVHPITGEELIALSREEFQYEKPVRVVTKTMIRFLGMFQPFMREMVEMMYLTEEPIILNGEKYERKIGPLPSTPYRSGIKATLQWIMKRHAIRR